MASRYTFGLMDDSSSAFPHGPTTAAVCGAAPPSSLAPNAPTAARFLPPFVAPSFAAMLSAEIRGLLATLEKHHSSWPFHKPVAPEEAPDYHDVIKFPTDIDTMKKKAKKLQYQSTEEFASELLRMFSNCRQYNNPTTIYYKYANDLEKFIWPKVRNMQARIQANSAPNPLTKFTTVPSAPRLDQTQSIANQKPPHS
eukprot:GHVT01025490.1.p1 GENE.GHVT01025490.1~~GHVT01025490.1.p1  ORF type:complete len:197 (-),score=53.19 GHVT01025490.1:587-1177(-)